MLISVIQDCHDIPNLSRLDMFLPSRIDSPAHTTILGAMVHRLSPRMINRSRTSVCAPFSSEYQPRNSVRAGSNNKVSEFRQPGDSYSPTCDVWAHVLSWMLPHLLPKLMRCYSPSLFILGSSFQVCRDLVLCSCTQEIRSEIR